jgi:cytochrome c peroxidase
MQFTKYIRGRSLLVLIFALPLMLAAADYDGELSLETVADLGARLFHDRNLSNSRKQSCATCHGPDQGFVDRRDNGGAVGQAVSLGDDGHSLGDRNAPSLSYVGFVPAFHRRDDGAYVGGLFWDGRASVLEDQAAKPILDPAEMAMSGMQAVLERLKENPDYLEAFPRFFGDDVLDDSETAYAAVTQAIAAFERSSFFEPFDSRYDRFLRGEVTLNGQEEEGRRLFFDSARTNCSLCHMLRDAPGGQGETFTDYRYHNVGVPVNVAVRKANDSLDTHADLGLLAHADVSEPSEAGKVKVPSLRNVAVTGPYMHNGVFRDLRTAVLFYNRYLSTDPQSGIDPETGKPWGEAEFTHNLSPELEAGTALDDREVDALVAFLKTLTDSRFEQLLPENGER